jgi:hypothetical protein
MLDTKARILTTREHYAAHGVNASIVLKNSYAGCGKEDKKMVTMELRRGREEDGEAVQIALEVFTQYDSGRTSTTFGSVSLSQEVWDAVVEHVKANRNIEMQPYSTKKKA